MQLLLRHGLSAHCKRQTNYNCCNVAEYITMITIKTAIRLAVSDLERVAVVITVAN